MANRLISETSPYLRQHAENPVDWYPWGEEAFEKARAEDKPIFLSVGYSACHWCHVMEHESFEDEATAALLGEHFVAVKVDREERPDVDAIYMDAVQALTGRGGWPMSVFLTPDAVPFYGGTYFPPESRYGMPSFTEVLTQLASIWSTRRDEVIEAAASLKGALEQEAATGMQRTGQAPEREVLDRALQGLFRAFDRAHGGWGPAPKFPQPAVAEFVLRRYRATGDERIGEMATRTLDAMMRGGIYDQLGGGFHRYATDEKWLVPHFEKMLYDNAQLARVYLHAWQLTGDERYRYVVTGTLDYVAREMLDPAGGFYSAQDADTEGVEGRFFVWSLAEVREVLAGAQAGGDSPVEADVDADAELFVSVYGVTQAGNFEGASILSVERTPAEVAADAGLPVAEVADRLAHARAALFDAREVRVRPALDDKVLAGWNGLALAAFAEAARVLGRDDYRAIAERNAEFLLAEMRTAEGRMLRTWQGGSAKLNGYLEDYAHCAEGLLELYQTTFDTRWFAHARELVDAVLEYFVDPGGGFFDTSDDHESLIVRPKTVQDGAMPSGGAVAADVCIRLTAYTGERVYADAADSALAQMAGAMEQAPLGFSRWLAALDLALAPPATLAIVGEDPQAMLDVVRAGFRPDLLVGAAWTAEQAGTLDLFEGREQHADDPIRAGAAGGAVAYFCRRGTCERAATTAAELAELLDG